MRRTSRIFYTTDSKKFNSEYGPDIHNERLEVLEFLYLLEKQIKKKFNSEYGPDIHNERLEVLEFLYLLEKFLANIFQKFFHYNTKSESSRSDSSEEENTEDSTQDSK